MINTSYQQKYFGIFGEENVPLLPNDMQGKGMREMNQEYLQKIQNIGDKIFEISESIKSIDTKVKISDQELKGHYQVFLEAITNYQKCKVDLLDINPPDKVQQEHTELANATQLFIDGAELIAKGIDLNTLSVNEEIILKGKDLQKQGEDQTVKLANEIVRNFVKD